MLFFFLVYVFKLTLTQIVFKHLEGFLDFLCIGSILRLTAANPLIFHFSKKLIKCLGFQAHLHSINFPHKDMPKNFHEIDIFKLTKLLFAHHENIVPNGIEDLVSDKQP